MGQNQSPISAEMREQLLGYLLGALEPEEQDALEAQVLVDLRLQAELRAMRDCLKPLHCDSDGFEPPSGLARRTCFFVASRMMEPISSIPGNWSPVDLIVACGIMVAASMLLFPAIAERQWEAQKWACQDHLRQFAMALESYSDHSGGIFPEVPRVGPLSFAGIVGPILRETGFLNEFEAVRCPGTRSIRSTAKVPYLHELEHLDSDELQRMIPVFSSDYGYVVGYVSEGRYHPTLNHHRVLYALIADCPSSSGASTNHGGRGQNVLFEDGHVQFCTATRLVENGDDFFLNRNGERALGVHVDDAAILRGDVSPFSRFLELVQ